MRTCDEHHNHQTPDVCDKTQDKVNGPKSGKPSTDCVSSAGINRHRMMTFIAAVLIFIHSFIHWLNQTMH